MAWVCVSGARWAAPGRARTTVRFSPLTSRGPMSSASIKAVGLIALLLSGSPPVRLSAQGLLSQFSYDNLKPSALQLDVGPLGAHFRHGSGPAINGTFVQDALNEITAGLNGTLGAEFGAKHWCFTLEARGVLSSGLSTASLRSGVMYRWAAK